MRNAALGDQGDGLLGAFFGHAASDERCQRFVVDGFLVGLVGFADLGLAFDAGLLVDLTLALGGGGLFGFCQGVVPFRAWRSMVGGDGVARDVGDPPRFLAGAAVVGSAVF